MNKSYKDRVFLKSVYQLVSLFGLVVMVLGFFGIMGVVGHSETEYVISSVSIWSAFDYVFYVLFAGKNHLKDCITSSSIVSADA